MKLVDALNILKRPSADGARAWDVALVAGFTPAHLATFLAAHLRRLDPDRRAEVRVGLFGDVAGNLGRLAGEPASAAAVVLEWSDLDPRLGLRNLGAWGVEDLPDILETAEARARAIVAAIEGAAGAGPIALALPTLPIPPADHRPRREAGPLEIGLAAIAAKVAARALAVRGVRVVSPGRIDAVSPLSERLDVRSDLASGFPYRLPHASALAEFLAALIRPEAPKKGLITDLDETLWSGLVGEVGPDRVSWDLDHRSHGHGLYQRMLASLADAGVLVAVVSKNDPEVVDEAFRRDDLILSRGRVFPMAVGWGPKSEAVGRVLRAWNVGPESVVFVDDGPMELAEVAEAHPEIHGLLFPKGDDQAIHDLLGRLRDLFGKAEVSEADALRLASLRTSAEVFGAEAGEGGNAAGPPEAFLEKAEAEITFDVAMDPPDPRALELINKTNQFNLNGRRFDEKEWLDHLRSEGAFLLLVAYKDKFGPLGTIAALTGKTAGRTVFVDQWVLSCRAFARRIEHACLATLFEASGASEAVFDFRATPRNGPLRDFFRGLLGAEPGPGLRLTRDAFRSNCPTLHHQLKGPTAWPTPANA